MKTYENMLDEIYAKLPEKKGATGERFEIPKVDATIEGKNTTIWKNYKRIADALRRDALSMSKYFSKEFGAPVNIDGERLIINRKVPPRAIEKKLDFFVKEYVLCRECGKVDTHVTTAQGFKMLVCEACGARRPIK